MAVPASPKCENGEAGEHVGGSNSVVESQPSKLLVAGSIPVSRSSLRSRWQPARELRLASRAKVVRRGRWRRRTTFHADVAQLAERVLGKDEVTSSILVIGSNLRCACRHVRERRLASGAKGVHVAAMWTVARSKSGAAE